MHIPPPGPRSRSGRGRASHHQRVLHTDDVAAQHGGLDLGHPDGLALPGVTHTGDDVVAPHRGELLAEELGAPVGLVGVLGDDGSLGHHDARAGVLKLGVDADVFALAEAAAVDLGVERHLAVGDEHAGDLLLLHSSCWRLRRTEGQLEAVEDTWRTLLLRRFSTHQQIRSVHVQRFLHIEGSLALQGGLLWSVHQGLHIVVDVAKLALVGGHQLPAGPGTRSVSPPVPSGSLLPVKVLLPVLGKLEAEAVLVLVTGSQKNRAV